jgi:alpha-glucosidase
MTAKNEFLWWQTGVVYQIYPRSFKDSNGDGIGDLQGVIEKLDYLTGILGVDAIWLSPFFPSPMKDFGYDVSDYLGVDPMFGDLETFERLMAEAHRRDLRVIIDLVPNHSSDQHPWFLESRSSRDNSRRDWYVWQDPKPDGSPPNNWLSNFGGSAWEWDEARGQYYLHSFLKEQPDLNWRNPEVKAAMFDIVRTWLDRGVDGFRIDVAHYIMKDPELRDNPPNPNPKPWALHRPLSDYDTQLHVHDKGHPDVHAVYREFRQILEEYSQERPRVSIGEIHVFEWPKWARYYGENLDELHMPFNFALLGAPWDAEQSRQIVEDVEAHLPYGAWPNYVLGNHDEARLVTRIGPEAARSAALLLLTLRGSPTLYYGDEIGMSNGPIPPEKEVDPWGLLVPGMSRDPERTPMQWDVGPHAGFAPPHTEELWLPLNPNYRQVNVAAQLEQPDSMLNLYRQLLAYRRQQPALNRGPYRSFTGCPEETFVYLRLPPTDAPDSPSHLIAINFGGSEKEIRLSGMSGQAVLSSTWDGALPPDISVFTLRAHEGLLFRLDHLDGEHG